MASFRSFGGSQPDATGGTSTRSASGVEEADRRRLLGRWALGSVPGEKIMHGDKVYIKAREHLGGDLNVWRS